MMVMERESDMYMYYFIIHGLRCHFVIDIFYFFMILLIIYVMMVEMPSFLLNAMSKQFELVNNKYDVKYVSCLSSNLCLYGMIVCNSP